MKRISNDIKIYYEKIIKENYTDKNWEKDGKAVTNSINTFKKLYNELNDKVNYTKENSLIKNEGTVSKVEEALESAKKSTLQYIQAINEKTRYYNNDFEMNNPADEEPAPQQQEIVMDLMNNKEVLQKRREELENIHKTAAILKDTTDQMAQDLNKQGAQLEEIEANVITSK